MFYSRSSLSRKGPLGAIWIAAYFLKRLKKAQVVDTHIPSSVDEILQNELDATVAYRVLAYLLLGLVRIYSKKVEYLFDDCQDVMFKIKDFFVGERSNSQLETRCLPNYTITVPDRFELEAFDLGILEDVSRDNVVPLEEITLKDCASKAVGIGLYSLGKYHCEELAAMHDIGSTDYLPTEEYVTKSICFFQDSKVPSNYALPRVFKPFCCSLDGTRTPNPSRGLLTFSFLKVVMMTDSGT